MQEENKSKEYEFNSYNSRYISDYCFGFDIFSLYSAEDISDMISNPMIHNQELRRLSNRLYSSNGLLTQCIDYCTALPTLDHCVIPKGRNNSKRETNKNLMESALRNIRHKEIVRDALFKDMTDGIAFYYCVFNTHKDNTKTMSDYDVENILEINDIGTNMSVIPLPTDYTKIVGRKNSSYVIAFNLRYFEGLTETELSRKLRLYPEEIKKGWAKYSKNNTDGKPWLVLDNKKTIVSKVRSKLEEPWGRPLCLAAIKNILYASYFQDTCRGTLDEINNRIVYQTFPEGERKGVCALTSNQQQEQHNKVKNAVLTKNQRNSTSFFSVAAGTKIGQLEADTSLLDEKNSSYIQDQIGLDLGFMANLLSGNKSGNYAAQQNNLQLLLSEVLMWLEPITEELVKVINENIIKDKENPCGLYYMPCSYITRKDFTSQMKELYLQGKGSLRAWISSTGFNADAYIQLMDMELDEGFDDKYKPHPTSYTLSSKDGDFDFCRNTGRPDCETPTSSSTITSKQNDANNMPSPSDLK